jgi:arabinan endo-1,5-alpha-L-arabinosidase
MGAHKSAIGVATSKSLESGSWTDRGSLDIPEGDYNLIDPYVFQDDEPDAPIYFTFGSYWSGIQQIEMSHVDQLRSYDGGKSHVENVIRNMTKDYAVVEGSTTHKHDGFYYNFFSVGQCCREDKTNLAPAGDEYHVVVCRSEHATGPYVDRDGKDCLSDNGGTTILASHDDVYAPGGGELMLDPKTQQWVIYYHYGEFELRGLECEVLSY